MQRDWIGYRSGPSLYEFLGDSPPNWRDPFGSEKQVTDVGDGVTSSSVPGSSIADVQEGTAVGEVTQAMVDAFLSEVDRLLKSVCTKLFVRRRFGDLHLYDAISKCDEVLIMAHGSADKAPYMVTASPAAAPMSSPEGGASAKSVKVAACLHNGQKASGGVQGKFNAWATKNNPGMATSGMPDDKASSETGESFLSDMMAQMTAWMAAIIPDDSMKDGKCCHPKKVCVLFGPP